MQKAGFLMMQLISYMALLLDMNDFIALKVTYFFFFIYCNINELFLPSKDEQADHNLLFTNG